MRQKVVLVLSIFGVGLVTWMWVHDPAWCAAHALVWGSLVGFMGLAFLGGVFFPLTRRWSKRLAGTIIAKQTLSLIKWIEAQVPFAASYRLVGTDLYSVFEHGTLKYHRRVELHRARLAIIVKPCVFLFRREKALLPFRMFYVAGAPEVGAVLDGLLRAGAAVEELSGPVEGYIGDATTWGAPS